MKFGTTDLTRCCWEFVNFVKIGTGHKFALMSVQCDYGTYECTLWLYGTLRVKNASAKPVPFVKKYNCSLFVLRTPNKMTELFTVYQTSVPVQQQQAIQSLQQPQTGHPVTSAATNRTSNHFSGHKQDIQSLQQPQTGHPITSAATNTTSSHFNSQTEHPIISAATNSNPITSAATNSNPITSAATNRTSNHFSSHKQDIQSLQQPQTGHPITSSATNRTSNHFSSHK